MSHIGDYDGRIYLDPHCDFDNLLSLVLGLGHSDVFFSLSSTSMHFHIRFHLSAFLGLVYLGLILNLIA